MENIPPYLQHDAKSHHWRFLYTRRRSSLSKNTREIFIGQLISLTGSIIAGYLLELSKGTLAAVAGVFLLLPGVFDMGGNIAGSFGAHINHVLEYKPKNTLGLFVKSLIHSLGVAAIASMFLGLVAGSLAALLFHASYWVIFKIAVFSALLSTLIGLPLVGIATVVAFKRGYDPDNFIGPIETSIFDSLSIVVVVLVMRMVI